MSKLIDADQFLIDESEAYISAQSKINDSLLRDVNEVTHKKIQMLIADAPAVDAEPIRHGEWLEWWPGDCGLIMTGEEMLYECNLCTAKFVSKSRYCPYCGARMDGERKEE